MAAIKNPVVISLTLDPYPEGREKISPSPSDRRVGMREG